MLLCECIFNTLYILVGVLRTQLTIPIILEHVTSWSRDHAKLIFILAEEDWHMHIESSQYFIILFRVNQVFTFYHFIIFILCLISFQSNTHHGL